MKPPKIKTGYRITVHRDETISYWNVFRQQWERRHRDHLSTDVLSSLPSADIARIFR